MGYLDICIVINIETSISKPNNSECFTYVEHEQGAAEEQEDIREGDESDLQGPEDQDMMLKLIQHHYSLSEEIPLETTNHHDSH